MGLGVANEKGMAILPMKKDDLLSVLRKNRKVHHDTYRDALEGYKVTCKEELTNLLKEVNEGKDVQVALHLSKPENHLDDYDRIIKMLEMTTLDEVKISEDEFAKYVMDDWHWKHQFVGTNAMYVGKAPAPARR